MSCPAYKSISHLGCYSLRFHPNNIRQAPSTPEVRWDILFVHNNVLRLLDVQIIHRTVDNALESGGGTECAAAALCDGKNGAAVQHRNG
jgi:hypothetical protein